jgi:hypothetical protein
MLKHAQLPTTRLVVGPRALVEGTTAYMRSKRVECRSLGEIGKVIGVHRW